MAAMEDCSSCAFSLTCPEDGADLGDGVVDDGDLFLFYAGVAAAEDEDGDNEYVEQLVSKEASFCSSSDSGDADCSSAASEDWFRQARLVAVKWILQVSTELPTLSITLLVDSIDH
jgi:cyclin D5